MCKIQGFIRILSFPFGVINNKCTAAAEPPSYIFVFFRANSWAMQIALCVLILHSRVRIFLCTTSPSNMSKYLDI